MKKIGLGLACFIIILSCSKDKSSTSNTKVCNDMDWSNTLGDEGFFMGKVVNNNYVLNQAEYRMQGDSSHLQYYLRDGNNQVINNNPSGFTYTYTNGVITSMTITDNITLEGTAVFSFDSQSHLTSVDINGNNGVSTLSQHNSYTYDNNGDPVQIHITLQTTDSKGTATGTFDITGTYLTNKPAILSPVPELAPYTIFFAFNYVLSKHLIDKWQIHQTGIDYDGSTLPDWNYTDNHTYTFNSDGTVATMVRSVNTNNTYTFKYSGCK